MARPRCLLAIILLMALAVWRSGAWERRVIREQLADEVGRAVTRTNTRTSCATGCFKLAASAPTGRTPPRHW